VKDLGFTQRIVNSQSCQSGLFAYLRFYAQTNKRRNKSHGIHPCDWALHTTKCLGFRLDPLPYAHKVHTESCISISSQCNYRRYVDWLFQASTPLLRCLQCTGEECNFLSLAIPEIVGNVCIFPQKGVSAECVWGRIPAPSNSSAPPRI
jgi:hypothetical protein